ncbi:hypothetical protein [Georgenia faecalis]|uniref:hypothetical protein n=1 Tax=Georgenia faecalis TaxID=2483799 RepID=UPI000FDB8B9E|nr:hypothetical protein [Georgenia faecalis]
MADGELLDRLVALGAAHGRPAPDVEPRSVRFAERGTGETGGWWPEVEVELGDGDETRDQLSVGAVVLEVPRADTLAVAEALLTGRGVYRSARPALGGGLRGVLAVFRRALRASIVVVLPGGRRYSGTIPVWAWDAARAVGTVPAGAGSPDPFTAWVERLPEAPGSSPAPGPGPGPSR